MNLHLLGFLSGELSRRVMTRRLGPAEAQQRRPSDLAAVYGRSDRHVSLATQPRVW
jgi:hypothetical protein